VSKSKRGTVIAGLLLGAAVVAIAVLSWRAGGPQELREFAAPVAVPELPQ
jgi:hypothetical protein